MTRTRALRAPSLRSAASRMRASGALTESAPFTFTLHFFQVFFFKLRHWCSAVLSERAPAHSLGGRSGGVLSEERRDGRVALFARLINCKLLMVGY